MNFSKFIGLILITSLVVACGSKLPEDYHMEKKYWDPSDYNSAIRYIKYSLSEEEGYPRLNDPLTAPVFNKLVDKQNVTVVLEDESLGLTHRDEVADEFWDASKDILKIYQVIDIQDKFIYPVEMVKAMDFFLHTQLLYFRVGNNKILKETVDPDAPNIKRLVQRNQQTVVNNFNNNLEYLAKEDAFSNQAINELAKVLGIQYGQLIKDNPNSNYAEMKRTIKLLIDKCESETVDKVLNKLITQLENLNK